MDCGGGLLIIDCRESVGELRETLVGFFMVVNEFLGIGAFGWRETEMGGGFQGGLLTDQVVVWRRRRVRSGDRGLK